MKARSSLGSELLLNYSSLGWSRAWGIWKTHTHCMRGHGGKENKKRIRTEIRVEGEWLYCYVRVQFEEGESKIRPGEVTKHQEERNWLMCPLIGELLSHCLVKKPLFIYIFFLFRCFRLYFKFECMLFFFYIRSHCMYVFCIFQLNACEIFIHFVEYRFNGNFYRTLEVVTVWYRLLILTGREVVCLNA